MVLIFQAGPSMIRLRSHKTAPLLGCMGCWFKAVYRCTQKKTATHGLCLVAQQQSGLSSFPTPISWALEVCKGQVCDSNRGRKSRRPKQLWGPPRAGKPWEVWGSWVCAYSRLPGSHVITQKPHVPPNDLHVRLTTALGKAGMGVY